LRLKLFGRRAALHPAPYEVLEYETEGTHRFSSPRTTKLYDRRTDDIALDEVEKIAI